MRVAVLHDYFDKQGGGERVALTLAEAFDADVYTGYVVPEKTYAEISSFRVTEVANVIRAQGLKTAYLLHRFGSLVLKGYDCIILSGTNCITASRNPRTLWYCHTPARHLYDLRREGNVPRRILIELLRRYQHPIDREAVRRCTRIVANSRNVQRRLLDYYGVPSSVVYPPVDTSLFRWHGQKDFYLSVGRLDPLKRIDVIIRAFKKMPGKELIILSSGPDMARLKKLAAGSQNICFTGPLPQPALASFVGRCTATVYIPVREDFGMSAAESLAAGKPCIAAAEGGLVEIVDDGKNGLLIEATEEEIIDAVGALDRKAAKKMRASCEKKAETFSKRFFVKNMKREVRKTIAA